MHATVTITRLMIKFFCIYSLYYNTWNQHSWGRICEPAREDAMSHLTDHVTVLVRVKKVNNRFEKQYRLPHSLIAPSSMKLSLSTEQPDNTFISFYAVWNVIFRP